MKRSLTFLLIYFAAIAVPVGLIAYMAVSGPPPYIVTAGGPGPEWSQQQVFDDRSQVLVIDSGGYDEAVEAARMRLDELPTSYVHRTLEVARYLRSDTEMYGLILPVDRYVVEVEAPTPDLVEARFAELDFITGNPERNVLWAAMTDHAGLSLALVGLYVVLLFVLLARGGAWAGRIEPVPGIAPSPANDLRRTLLSISDLKHPFHVHEERPGRLVAEWRLGDPDWMQVMAVSGLRRAHRFYIELDDAEKRVRVLEKTYRIGWNGAINPASGRVAFFQGINFKALDGGARLGVSFEPERGLVADPDYPYRFDASEIRKPLVETVTGAGWRWQPVMTLFRPIGG